MSLTCGSQKAPSRAGTDHCFLISTAVASIFAPDHSVSSSSHQVFTVSTCYPATAAQSCIYAISPLPSPNPLLAFINIFEGETKLRTSTSTRVPSTQSCLSAVQSSKERTEVRAGWACKYGEGMGGGNFSAFIPKPS